MAFGLPILDSAPQRPVFAQGPRSLAAVKLLRISLTDRCNLRCLYCMPDEGVEFAPQDDVLSADHVIAVATAARDAGVTHFKLTGGEPMLRPDLLDIVARIKALNPTELSMTTNGLGLGRGTRAADLAAAGLDRITVSLDALDEPTFKRISGSRGFTLANVWRGLDAAQAAGFGSGPRRIKLNVVMIGGINGDQAADFAALTHRHPWTVRFIEYMPLGDSDLTRRGANTFTLDNAEVQAQITAVHGPLIQIDRSDEPGVGPAQLYQLKGAIGKLGFISAMSQPFCETCNRLRLTATGELRACLFDGGEVNLMPALSRPSGANIAELRDLMAQCVAQKPDTHSGQGNRAMSQLGG
ncbi:MAG: GTP 3',8-cyclase MoaA [Algisphaera sp.]